LFDKLTTSDLGAMTTLGQIVSLAIDKPAAGGAMIARLDGQVILVTGAIPGERVRARITRIGKGIAYAEAIEIEEASPDRRTCGDPACGGSLFGYIAYARQLTLKSQIIADAFRRIGRLTLPSDPAVTASPEDGYRMRARLHVRERRIGFFRENTHALCDPRPTRQLLAATCDVLSAIEDTIKAHDIDAIREIEVSENVDASERVVHFDTIANVGEIAAQALAATPGLTGVVSEFATTGAPAVVDRIEVATGVHVALRRHVLAFFQGNRHLLTPFVAHVMQQLPDSGPLVDLYAGVGLFALSAAAARGVEVTAVEGDRYAAMDLAGNAAAAAGTIAAVHQSVEEFLRTTVRRQPKPPATLIVDPPRTGMSKEALDGVLALRASRLIYVSCDVATLARDARRLVDGDYAVERIDAFDLFPNTPHVETVVVFTRAG
jgi:23S rRNA (uracil1939-C5)-methyltransferase